ILSAHCGDGISLLLADLTVIHMPNLSHFGLESKKPNKTVVATAGKVTRSLRSGRLTSAVPHF
ncbi:hypothetical protein, partial [Haloferula sp.]|uniref:hypothetical protein n=1 Tax=Haloferula sp. TaxID=2497595 RepID=UPI003C70BE41